MSEAIKVRVCREKVYPETRVQLPCDLCAEKRISASVYLKGKADEASGVGFYPSMSIRLCRKCLQQMLAALEGEE